MEGDRKPLAKRGFMVFALAAATIAAAAFFIVRLRSTGFRWEVLLARLGDISPGFLSASIFLILLSYLGRVVRWRVMIRGVRPDANFRHILSATLIGFTAVVFFGRPGELVRPYLVARKEHVPLSSQMAAWVVERIYDLLMVLLLFGFALTRLEANRGNVGPALGAVLNTGGYVAAALAAGAMGVLFLAVAFESPARRWAAAAISVLPKRLHESLQTTFEAFLSGISFAGSPRVVAELVILSLAEWVVIVGSIYTLFLAYPATAHLSLLDVLVFTGFIALGSIVQLPGIGGGMQVVAVIVLTELFGLTLESATGLALFLWVVSWLIVVPFGVGFAFHEGLRWSSLRHVDQEIKRSEVSRLS